MLLTAPAVLALLELVRWPLPSALAPPMGLSFRVVTAADERLAGPSTSVYRAQPEILMGFRPAPHLDVFVGGGVGPAYVVRPAGRGDGVRVTASGEVGLRFPVDGTTVRAMARIEGLGGGGVAITLDVQMREGRRR